MPVVTTFQSLGELVEELEVGDWLLWIGKHAEEHAGETSAPNRVTAIERDGETIRVEGEGIRGGQYHFEIHPDGTSEAVYHNPNRAEPRNMGPVVVARLTDSSEPVRVERVFDDTRGPS